MSKYTTELRYLIEGNYDIGLKNYPIFDEDYRESLNNKIINHYYFREIGFETEALFVNRLNQKMNEIMPYFNQRYKSELLSIDPLSPMKVKEKIVRDLSSEQNANSTFSTDNSTKDTIDSSSTNTYGKIEKFSDIAQAQTTANQILNDNYLTNATVNDGEDIMTNKGSQTRNVKGTNEGLTSASSSADENVNTEKSGNLGFISQSKLLNEYRTTFLNVDIEVIEALSDLFISLW